jgi:hypothetical protein
MEAPVWIGDNARDAAHRQLTRPRARANLIAATAEFPSSQTRRASLRQRQGFEDSTPANPPRSRMPKLGEDCGPFEPLLEVPIKHAISLGLSAGTVPFDSLNRQSAARTNTFKLCWTVWHLFDNFVSRELAMPRARQHT